jgi:hypothetical protein
MKLRSGRRWSNFQVLSLTEAAKTGMGHFETKSDVYRFASVGLILLREPTFWRSVSKVGALLGAAEGERRQTKRNSLADNLAVAPKVLADLQVEKAGIEGQRKVVEADLGRCGIWQCCSVSPTIA